MPKPPPLVTDALAELQAFQANDPTLLLEYATGLVRGYCGWHIAPEVSETLIVDGSGTRELLLPSLHVTDVSWISNDGETVPLTDVAWWHYGRLVRLVQYTDCGVWTAKPRGVEVDVTHGYADTPADVRAVIASVTARASVTPSGVVSESAGSVSITYTDAASGLTTDELRVLDRYRIWNRP